MTCTTHPNTAEEQAQRADPKNPMCLSCPPDSTNPNLIEHLLESVCAGTSLIYESPTPQDPKDPMPISPSQAPQDTPRSLLSVSWWLRPVLAAQEELAKYKAGGFHVAAVRCMSPLWLKPPPIGLRESAYCEGPCTPIITNLLPYSCVHCDLNHCFIWICHNYCWNDFCRIGFDNIPWILSTICCMQSFM